MSDVLADQPANLPDAAAAAAAVYGAVGGVAAPGVLPGAAAAAGPLAGATSEMVKSLEMLHDVEMAVTVELGRTRMSVRDLLRLAQGSVVELDKAAGAPVDILVNGTPVARGEVVVVDDEYGVRISEVVGRAQDRLVTGA